MFGHLSLGKLSAGHVSGRPGLQETGAELDRESVATTLCQFTVKREKRSRHKRCAFVEREKNLQKILERKVDLAVRGEREVSAKVCTKLRLRLRREIGRREILILPAQEINQEFESQRFQLHQASRWADQAQRLTNRLFRDDHARNC